MDYDVAHINRGYRRGAIMGLTIAEAFILITFALLLLFAFWQWETHKENTEEVQAFKQMPDNQKKIVVTSINDGSMQAFVILKENGVNFATPSSTEKPHEKWRFIDKDEQTRLLDAVAMLPEDVQRDLADLVEANSALPALKQMAALQELVKAGQSINDLKGKIRSLEGLLATQRETPFMQRGERQKLEYIIQSLKREIAALRAQKNNKTLQGITGKIRAAAEQEEELVNALRAELGGLVSSVDGQIDESGAIILSNAVLFEQGEASITPELGQFLANACGPWLTVLKNSGVEIAEVKIEGHASSEWHGGVTPQVAYLSNLDLSQRRSQAVLKACLDIVSDENVLEWARKHLIAVGYSSVRPVMKDGQEDQIASRRVVFSVTPNREELFEEIESEAQGGSVAYRPGYDRSLFGGWADFDKDCQNTRQELLQKLSTKPVQLSGMCTVTRGRWLDPYTGRTFLKAHDIEIDHVVPLRWAWDHGADQWSSSGRRRFANDISNLLAVHDVVNQKKGALGPLNWLPPDQGFHCQYVTRFLQIVQKYSLELTNSEWTHFRELRAKKC